MAGTAIIVGVGPGLGVATAKRNTVSGHAAHMPLAAITFPSDAACAIELYAMS